MPRRKSSSIKKRRVSPKTKRKSRSSPKTKRKSRSSPKTKRKSRSSPKTKRKLGGRLGISFRFDEEAKAKVIEESKKFDEMAPTVMKMWVDEGGSTLQDLKRINLKAIKGELPGSWYHQGPLEVESYEIIDYLTELHKYGIITISSQAAGEEVGIDLDKTRRMKNPMLEFFIENDKVEPFVIELLKIHPSAFFSLVRLKDGFTYTNALKKVKGDQYYIDGKWEQEKFSMNSNRGLYKEYRKFMGPNFKNLLEDHMTNMVVTDESFNNKIFDSVLKAAKNVSKNDPVSQLSTKFSKLKLSSR